MSDIIKRVYEHFHATPEMGSEIMGPGEEIDIVNSALRCDKWLKKHFEEVLKNDCWMLPDDRAILKKKYEAICGH